MGDPIGIYQKMDKGEAERVERDLEQGARTFRALLADDQSTSRPDGTIGKHRSLVEAEPQSYHAACNLAHQGIWTGALGQVLQRVMNKKRFELTETLCWTEAHLSEVDAHV